MSEERPAQKQHEARASRLYELDPSKEHIKLRNRKCPRCGSFMAHHAKPMERWTCGSCTFTEYTEKRS